MNFVKRTIITTAVFLIYAQLFPAQLYVFDAKHDDLVRTRHCVQRFRRYDVAGGHHFRVEHDVCRQKLK